MARTVEIRCPRTRRLFTKLSIQNANVVEGNLMEFSCDNCRKLKRQQEGVVLRYVLHRYNFLGEWVETVEVP